MKIGIGTGIVKSPKNRLESADMEITVQPSSLAARNYLSLQKLFGNAPEVCQIYLQNVVSHPIFH